MSAQGERTAQAVPAEKAVPAAGSAQAVPAAAAEKGARAVPVPAALGRVLGQPRVRDFLASALAEGRLSHAYLFVGAPGSGRSQAAEALAKCVVCPAGGDDSCDECRRVSHRSHPDVHWLEPGSSTGYLVAQVRELMADAALAPMRAPTKVYVLQRAELLRDSSANALLKTLEEPPTGVMFVLCARSADAVLPTIVSRCQLVRFRTVSPRDALAELMSSCACTPDEARVALAVAGSAGGARDYLSSPSRQDVRRRTVDTLGSLAADDGWDVLLAASELLEAVRVPLGDVRAAQEEAVRESTDFLTSSALRQVEDANKRELTARERSGMMECLAAAESLLRDVLLRCEDVGEPIVNSDAAAIVDRLAAGTDPAGAIAALGACSRAADDLVHNVSAQLTLEVMLLRIKEALTCPPSFR